MTEKIRISPKITKTSKEVMSKHGIGLGQAYEQYALLLATKNPVTVARKQLLLEQIKEYDQDIQKLVQRRQEAQAEVDRINEEEKKSIVVENEGFDTALRLITIQLGEYAQADADGKWDLRKMKLKEVSEICSVYSVPMDSVLRRVNPHLLRYVEGYTTLCL